MPNAGLLLALYTLHSGVDCSASNDTRVLSPEISESGRQAPQPFGNASNYSLRGPTISPLSNNQAGAQDHRVFELERFNCFFKLALHPRIRHRTLTIRSSRANQNTCLHASVFGCFCQLQVEIIIDLPLCLDTAGRRAGRTLGAEEDFGLDLAREKGGPLRGVGRGDRIKFRGGGWVGEFTAGVSIDGGEGW